jgi:hypothetical protein
MKMMRLSLLFAVSTAISLAGEANIPDGYKGRAYEDELHAGAKKGVAQEIPGRVQAAWFDVGGEGVAYHDVDAVNHGSGELNHKPEHCEDGVAAEVCLFREKEGVDISYVKKGADLNHENMVAPEWKQLYVGWTEDGEWVNYTVDVKKAGMYKVVAMYTHLANTIPILANGAVAGECKLPVDPATQVDLAGKPDWMVWHVWNKAECGEVRLAKGKQVLTVKISKGNNFAYWDFVEKK